MEALLADLRYAVRSLHNSPTVTLVAVVTLALGIGANASVFGVVDTLLFRPPAHVQDPGAVKRIYFQQRGPSGERASPITSFPVYVDFTDHARSFTELTATSGAREVSLGTGDESKPAKALLVAHTYFPLLGVQPALGRFFGAEEDQPGVGAVAVVSYGFWQRRFGGDPQALGKTLRIGSDVYTVIGVSPKGFTGVNVETVDLWLPMRRANAMVFEHDVLADRNAAWLTILGRVREGVSTELAQRDLTRVFSTVTRGARNIGFDSTASVILAPIHQARGPNPSADAKISVWLGAVAVLVLLIVCANVANVLLAHAMRRRHDVAVRLALGAGRSRVLREVFVQTAVLALLAGLAALLVAAWTAPVLQAVLLRDLPADWSALDVRVFVFTVAVALLAGVLAGVIPAIHASRPDVVALLKSESRGASPRGRTRAGLLVVQVALTLVLLAGAGLFIRSIQNIRADLGFNPERVVVGTMQDLQRSGRSSAEINGLYLRMLERLRRVPGVEQVAASIGHPFGWSFARSMSIPGRDSIPSLNTGGPYISAVTPEFFHTLGARILRGRGFTAADRAGSPPVAVVNETMARLVWPGENLLGKCIQVDSGADCYVTVGVVADVRRGGVVEEPTMQFYIPFGQHEGLGSFTALFVRARGNAGALIGTVAREMHSVEPDLPYATVLTLEEMMGRSIRPWRMGTAMFSLFGLLALAVAAVGLYGVLTYTVEQRAHELGVRIALGAESREVLRLVVGQGLRVTATGVLAGAAGALVLGRALSPFLYEVTPLEPRVLGAVAGMLLAVAVLASYLPARRATRTDPMVALRAE